MTAIASRMIPEIATKFKIGTAACAIAVAAAVPAHVANAELAVPAPIAPVMQVLSSGPILGPIDFAQQPVCPGPECPTSTAISGFSALFLIPVGLFLLPVLVVAAVISAVVSIFFRVGPYGTGRS